MANIPTPPSEAELFGESNVPPPPPEHELYTPSKFSEVLKTFQFAVKAGSALVDKTKEDLANVTALPKKAMQTVATTIANTPKLGPGMALADAAMRVMKPDFKPETTGEKVAGVAADLADPRLLALGPLGKGAKAIAETGASKLGGALEAIGAKGQNFAAGLRPQTIEALTKAGENPAEVGLKIGSQLAKEEIVGDTAKQTFTNVQKAHVTAGEEVGKAIKAINKGQTTVEAETVLNPLKKAVEERTGAITSARQAMGKPFQQVYDHFVGVAAKNSGKLGLDTIREAMAEVGPMTHKGSEEVQAAMAELYGTLANMQDAIVTKVADTAKNPSLKSALLDANKKYSLYSRILPDIKRAAAKESTGKTSALAHPIEAVKHFAATKLSGIIARSGTGLTKLGENPQNKAALDSAMARLKHA